MISLLCKDTTYELTVVHLYSSIKDLVLIIGVTVVEGKQHVKRHVMSNSFAVNLRNLEDKRNLTIPRETEIFTRKAKEGDLQQLVSVVHTVEFCTIVPDSLGHFISLQIITSNF